MYDTRVHREVVKEKNRLDTITIECSPHFDSKVFKQVQVRAYFLWKNDIESKGCSEFYWEMAKSEIAREDVMERWDSDVD